MPAKRKSGSGPLTARASPPGEPRPDPPESRSIADRAYDLLRLEIVECRLPPGQRLTEASAADWLDVGKMPAREALRRLVLEGLVRVIPRHGYAVSPITLRHARELFELRSVVEPAAAERAAGRIDAAEQARLRKLSDVGYRPGGPESIRSYLRANTEFHGSIARLSGNRRMAECVAGLLRESERLINFILPAHPRSEPFVLEHRRLLDALTAGNRGGARKLAEAHVRATGRMVIEAIMASGRLEDTPIGE